MFALTAVYSCGNIQSCMVLPGADSLKILEVSSSDQTGAPLEGLWWLLVLIWFDRCLMSDFFFNIHGSGPLGLI